MNDGSHFSVSALLVCLGFVIVWPLNRVQLFATPWTVAHQAPLSMGFPRQEHWSGLPFPSLGNLPNPGIEPGPLMSLALTDGFSPTEPPEKAPVWAAIMKYHRLDGL